MARIATVGLSVLLIAGRRVLWFLTQTMIGARKLKGGAIYDHLHVKTAGINAWLHQNPRVANAFLVASSLGVDVVTLCALAYSIFGPTFTPFWGLFGSLA